MSKAKVFLSVPELAALCGVSPATVYRWNCKNRAPRRYRLGKHIRYRRADVDSWLETRADDGGQVA